MSDKVTYRAQKGWKPDGRDRHFGGYKTTWVEAGVEEGGEHLITIDISVGQEEP